MSINVAVLTGRLTAEPELKVTPSGKYVTSFTIAVDRKYGEEKQADFITCVAWGKTAEFIAKYFRKGAMIGIEGSIQTRNYTDKNGNKRTAFEVLVGNASFCGSKSDNAQSDPINDVANKLTDLDVPNDIDLDDDLPF